MKNHFDFFKKMLGITLLLSENPLRGFEAKTGKNDSEQHTAFHGPNRHSEAACDWEALVAEYSRNISNLGDCHFETSLKLKIDEDTQHRFKVKIDYKAEDRSSRLTFYTASFSILALEIIHQPHQTTITLQNGQSYSAETPESALKNAGLPPLPLENVLHMLLGGVPQIGPHPCLPIWEDDRLIGFLHPFGQGLNWGIYYDPQLRIPPGPSDREVARQPIPFLPKKILCCCNDGKTAEFLVKSFESEEPFLNYASRLHFKPFSG